MSQDTIAPPPPRQFRYFDIVVALYVTSLFCSNFIAAAKIGNFAGYAFGAGILIFPFSYIFADILTEVYGYSAARRCVWIGFTCLAIASMVAWMVVTFPPDPQWRSMGGGDKQQDWESVFGSSWRIVLASFIAFWAGELTNSFVLSKMKILTKGKYLWTRTIGSTIVGQAIDSALFYPLGLMAIPALSAIGLGVGLTLEESLRFATIQFFLKVAVEVLATPLTYVIVGWLKRREHFDAYDVGVDYNPFRIRWEFGRSRSAANVDHS